MDRILVLSMASAIVFIASSAPLNAPHPDKVIHLPGAPLAPEFHLFSGYLNGSSNGTSVPIFYVLAEAIRVDPSTAPLIVWFNGGPGGSSLAAFFKEHGPYRITEAGNELTYNEFSWNQYANVMYFESPLGVGFSQNTNEDETNNDIDAANINFNALRDFMMRVHPNYGNRDYYLSGQSYAGAFVPYFASRILKGIGSGEMTNEKFKGFAIGNPVFEDKLWIVANFMQFHSYGLLPQGFAEKVLESWEKYTKGELTDIEYYRLRAKNYAFVQAIIGMNNPVHYNFIEHCYNQTDSEIYHFPKAKRAIGCFGNETLTKYLNRNDVQTSLHVGNATVGTKNWESINKHMAGHDGYNRDENVLHVYDNIFRFVNGSSFRVLVYHGDTDVMLPPVHTIEATAKIAANNSMVLRAEGPWTFYNDFAGIRRGYSNGIATMDVVTVRGSGHSVPTDLPAQAFQIINNFIFTEANEVIDYSKPIKKH